MIRAERGSWPRVGVTGWGPGRGAQIVAALALLAILVGACARTTGSIKAKPFDLYAALPSLSEVRAVLGDDGWWPGPPSFGVRPLDIASMPLAETFSITQRFVHVGTEETFVVDYTLWATTSAASGQMTSIQTALGTSVTGPKVGDQALYYGTQGSGAAPYSTFTFVRIGSIVTSITWSRKDGFPRVAQLGKIAGKVVSRLKDLIAGKLHGSPVSDTDVRVLPPKNLDITLLGTARISVEAAMVMIGATSVDVLAQTLRAYGVNDVVLFGDYVLDSDTHMEVRASVLTFGTAKDANDWVAALNAARPTGQDASYDSTHGWYLFPFAAGTKAAMLMCQSTAMSEAASRSCEVPLSRVISAWKSSLGS